jgi:precorrin isomerase
LAAELFAIGQQAIGKSMDSSLIDNMKKRLIRLRRVAAIAHDKSVVELVTLTADEIEADLRSIESGYTGVTDAPRDTH